MKIIKFVVGADGVVTCNGTRRAQKAGVQGDNKACTLEFDVSAVAKENAEYFIECVLGNGTPLILSEESDGVRFADNVLSVVLDSTVSAQGGNVEIRVVQVTAIDEMYVEVVEENTYSCFIYFESKSLAMAREKLRAYGVFLELKEYAKNLQGDANNKYNEANSKLSAAIVAYENAMNALEQGVAINDEYFSFEDGLLRLSQEYLAKISVQFDEKQGAFELNSDEALEFAEGANGKPVLRLKSSREVYQDGEGLHVDIGDGLKKDNDGRICADYTEHNVDEGSHNDIRLVIENLKTKVNTLLDSDDTTLDQMSEIVAYIKANKSLIDSVTTSKVNVADIIDNLTTNVSNKPLSAKQGVELKKLIDAIKIPTSLSEFNNDEGFVDDDYVADAVESVNLPRNVRVTDYDSNSVTVVFETGGGSSLDCVYDVDLTVDGKHEVFLYKFVDDGEYCYALAQEGDKSDGCEGRVYAFTYKVRNGAMHYLAVGNTVVLNKLVTIESITADGTAGTYTFQNLNLDYFLINISSLKGAPSNQSYRVYVNGDPEKIVGYFNNMVHTTNNNKMFVRVDLKNIQSLRGMANDASSITAMESEVATRCLEKLSKITSVTIAPYNKDVLIQSGSTITLKGREEE